MRWYRIAIVSIAALVAIGASVLSWDNARVSDLQPRFHWPDETTNWYFASRVAAGESLEVPEPRNVAAENLIHPRTANVRADGALVPGAYLGMPLWYGLVGRAFGTRAMLFLTPLLAALGLIAFATIVARLAWRAVALIATVLLALHPALWMFTATAMLPNVPFVAVLLCGVAVLAGEHSNDSNPIRMLRMFVRWFFGGLLIGLALTFRTHEIAWVATFMAVMVWHARPGWRAVCVGAVGIALPFIPILFLNAQLYGSPFTTGYSLLQEGGALPTEFVAGNIPFVGVLRAFIAPFGWHPIEALARFWQYMVVPYWWFVALATIGIVARMTKHQAPMTKEIPNSKFQIPIMKRLDIGNWKFFGHWNLVIGHSNVHTVKRWKYSTLTAVLALWLVLYYGSWTLADPLVRDTNVLTISYARYWLPIVVLFAPWAAWGFMAIVYRAGQWRHAVVALLLLAIALTSGWQIVRDPLEGLVRQRQAVAEHRARALAAIAVTPKDAVIVSHRMDKVFFPERAVVYAPEVLNDDFEQRLTALLATAPVFWYAPNVPMLQHASLEFIGAMPFNELLYRVRAE